MRAKEPDYVRDYAACQLQPGAIKREGEEIVDVLAGDREKYEWG